MRNSRGFTLIEILIAMAILVVGLFGLLYLLRAGLHSTKEAIEDSNASIIAESALASLQASVQQITPKTGSQLEFFHDGIPDDANTFDRPASGQSLYIPGGIGVPSATLTPPGSLPSEAQFCVVGRGVSVTPANNFPFNVTMSDEDPGMLQQYSFNIEITPALDQNGDLIADDLYDVIIRIRRQTRTISRFHTQIVVPPILE